VSPFDLNPEQRKAATTLAGPVLICAGAGSGKTRVLTERTANAVVDGAVEGWDPVRIGEILAITFTEKAAGELAERIKGALRAAGYLAEARRVDAAWVSTMHGMCTRILRAEAVGLGLDPEFRIVSGVELSRLRTALLDDVLSDATASSPDAARLLGLYGFSALSEALSALADFIDETDAHPGSFDHGAARPARRLFDEAVGFFSAMDAELADLTPTCEAAGLHRAACADTASLLRGLESAELDDAALAEELYRVLQEHRAPGKWAGMGEQRSAIAGEIARLSKECATATLAPLSRELVALADEYNSRFRCAKQALGALDFNDLERLTRRLLGNPAAAARWADRFKLTLVDEFQDTNETQLAVVRALAGENLCTVGDARQSIYGFRGAQVEVFEEQSEEMAEQGAVRVDLGVNYRSHADVLGFANVLFSADELFGPDLQPLEHGRDRSADVPLPPERARVEIVLGQESDGARSKVADELAGRFESLHVEQGIPPSDMVVLLRTYTHAAVYAQALRRRGLEAVVLGGKRFLILPEVAALRSALRVMVNEADDSAVLQFAASELVGLSDAALVAAVDAAVEHSTPLVRAFAIAGLDEVDERLAAAMVHGLEVGRQTAATRTLGEVFLRLAECIGADLRFVAEGVDGAQAYANLLKLARMADAFGMDGGGLAGFSAYLDDLELFDEHEAPASLLGEGAQVVRIMSIHSSKGLEYPVVAVAELDAPGKSDSHIARWERRSDRVDIGMKLPSSIEGKGGTGSTDVFDSLKEAGSMQSKAEVKRLFYVACTRARDYLLLTGVHSFKPSKASTMLQMMVEGLDLPLEPGRDEPIELAGGLRVGFTAIAADAPVPEEGEGLGAAGESAGIDEAAAQRAFLAAIEPAPIEVRELDAPAPRRLSYSGIARYRACPRRYGVEQSIGRLDTESGGAGATRLGSAVHAVLELYGEVEAIDDARVSAIATTNGLDRALRARLSDAVERYRSSALATRVAAVPSVRREVAFAVRIEDEDGASFLLDGQIDVYGRDGDRALIIDYKSGTRPLDTDALREKYRLQAECYALAALRDGAQEVEVVFVRPEMETAAGELETVGYRFSADDEAGLVSAPLEAWQAIRSGWFEPLDAWCDEECGHCSVSETMCPIKAGGAG